MEQLSVMSMHSILCSYGDVFELDYQMDTDAAIKELKNLTTWISGTNFKSAVNLTGPIEDIGLDAPADVKHARNQPYNDNIEKCPTIKKFFDRWTELARCRVAHLNSGSFFRPHRDAFRLNDQFRIFIPLNNTGVADAMFSHGDQLITTFKPGVPYILNTRKVHGLACFTDNTYQILLSLYINEHNMNQISKMLPNCKEH
jgi:hypothetical protein